MYTLLMYIRTKRLQKDPNESKAPTRRPLISYGAKCAVIRQKYITKFELRDPLVTYPARLGGLRVSNHKQLNLSL